MAALELAASSLPALFCNIRWRSPSMRSKADAFSTTTKVRPLPFTLMTPSLRSVAKRSARAFTLIEILVVLAILGMLAGLAITNFDKIFGGAQESTAQLFVN